MQALDLHLMALAAVVAKESRDPDTKVGCVITGRDGRLIVSGFNAFPQGCEETPDRLCRPEKYRWTEHAERRALNHAARFGVSVDNGAAHVTYFPCDACARSMVDSGIRRVVAPEPDLHHPTWGDSHSAALRIFEAAGVAVTFMEVPDVSE